MSNAQFILELCNLINSQIDITIQRHYFYWNNQMGLLYNKGNNNIGQEDEQKLMIFATQLIYTLRTFMMEEDIIFHMASKTKEGQYAASAFVPQSEILRSLSAVSKKAIGVSNIIQKDLVNKHKNDTRFAISRKNLWNQVEDLATPQIDEQKSHKIEMKKSKDGSPHYAYQSLKRDMMVYILYHGNKGNYTKYYDQNGDGRKESLMVFNNGWLWEWYNKILYSGSDMEYLYVNDSIMNGSLKPIMMTPDYIRGTKQGDFQMASGQQIQSKYNNTKIISYNNIRQVIYELKIGLEQYLIEKSQSSEKLLNTLQEHFIPETANNGAQYANQIIDEKLISKLKIAKKT